MTVTKRLRNRSLCFLMVLLFAGPAAAEVHEYKLDNGLKLIVKEDHRAPVVVSQVWYKVGSTYEHDGITGLSHVLEHMMFKGTRRHPAGEFSRIISEQGGRENAFTGSDYTAYFQQLEQSRLKVSFELEADRMRNLTMPGEEFDKELKVVMEERRLRTEDQPTSLVYEQFKAVSFLTNPARIPVIGWMNDLKNLKVEDIREWYRTWYAPNNATVVVVGDVDPEAVLKLAKKYFGPLKPGVIEPPKPREEPPQTGERRLVVRAPAELPYLIMGYRAPVLTGGEVDSDMYALEVLTAVLDGGASARLPKNLVRGSQVAADVDAGFNLYARNVNNFLLDGTPAQGKTIAELEQALREQIKMLRDKPVDEAELGRIKAQVVAQDVYQRDSVFYQAMQIGTLETVGYDWRLLDEYVDRVRAVTPAQVQAVARKYLNDEQLTVAILDPLPLDPNKPRPMPAAGGDHVR